ncbi:MAG: hypothetical protein WC989_07515 [Micavibrio sp.]
MERNFHEDYDKSAPEAPALSDRNFGLASGGILFAAGLIKLLSLGWIIAWVFLLGGACLIAASLIKPSLLAAAKNGFLKAAPFIARVLNPVLMGIVFIVCFVPAGLIMRLIRRDALHQKYDPILSSYWVKPDRNDLPDPMKYQF